MARAELVAVSEERIAWVGREDDLHTLRGPDTKVIDCEGGAVVPGFIDAHTHVLAFAASLLSLDISPGNVSSIEEIKAAIKKRALQTPPGNWIRATGYSEFHLAEKRHPKREDLDEATPQHPVKLNHRSGHACVLNTLALSIVGISRETPDPPGGLIDRNLESGEPTGLLFDMEEFLSGRLGTLSREELQKGIKLASREFLSKGITSLHDATATNSWKEWQVFQRLKAERLLAPRVYFMVGHKALEEFQKEGLSFGSGDDELRLGAVKFTLGETSGTLHPPREELNKEALHAHKLGYQLAFHAVEESTVNAAVDALEYVLQRLPRANHRHRIEHCSVCPPALLERLRRLNSVVVTNPAFLYHSGDRYLSQIAETQLPWLYRVRAFLEGGLHPAAGSDCPVTPPDPILGLYATVTRKAQTGQVLSSEETISFPQALEMHALAGAYASFQERIKGSIALDKLADLVVLSANPLELLPEQIRNVQVKMTILGGEVVWEG